MEGVLSASSTGAYRYYVLLLATLTSLLAVADRLVLSILLEDIKAEFVLSDTQLGLLAGLAFTFFYVTLGIPIARLADRSNRKNIVAASLTLWSLMTALCGAATGFVSLFLARLGVGIGEAGGGPPTYSILADYFRPQELARAMGIYSLGATLGTVVGLMAGGFFADLWGWRTAFFMLGVPGVVLGVVLFFTLREPQRGRFSDKGADDGATVGISATLRSLAGNRAYLGISLSFALLTVIGYAMAIWLAPVMQRNFGVSTGDTGLYLGLAFTLGGVPGALAGGFLTDFLVKFNAAWRGWLPALCAISCLPAYYLCLTATAFWPFLLFFAAGYAIFMLAQAPTLSFLQSSIKPGERALAVSLALLVNNILGQAIGPLVIGGLSDNLLPVYGPRALNLAVMILCGFAGFAAALTYLWTNLQGQKAVIA